MKTNFYALVLGVHCTLKTGAFFIYSANRQALVLGVYFTHIKDLKHIENKIQKNTFQNMGGLKDMSKSVYEMVTERIISELEKGVIPWQKPWTGVRAGAYNRISKKSYSLLNQMLLKHEGEYATFKQWTDLGGHIKKGAKSEIVVFWKIQPVKETKEDGTEEVKQIPLLRYFNVFHISQVEGVEPLSVDSRTELEPIEEAERIFNEYLTREHITLEQTASNEAYYSPLRDMIHLPLMEQFKNEAEYYSTAFHEATHSTGHSSRLDRLATEQMPDSQAKHIRRKSLWLR